VLDLPTLDPLQRRVLQTAVSLIGYPYVWAGEDARTARGFDCSGFVWRIYRTTKYVDAPQLPTTVRGRTTVELSGEAPLAQRIAFDDLVPGRRFLLRQGPGLEAAGRDPCRDLPRGGWMTHSSRFGVALAAVDGWYRTSFAWARGPLAEAGHPNATPGGAAEPDSQERRAGLGAAAGSRRCTCRNQILEPVEPRERREEA
jgi:hypothetical protein